MALYDTILWDWNGTLLDDVQLCVKLLNTMLTRYGYAPVYDTEEYRRIFCFPIQRYYERAGFDFSRVSYSVLSEEYMKLYIPQSLSCGLQKDARKVLSRFQQCGIRQVILSASEKQLLCSHVAHHHLEGYFDTLLGLSDIYAKSKTEIGLAWLKESGCDPKRAVMIGDSVHDFEVSQALGISCILFAGGHQLREILAETGAPVVDSLCELSALIAPKL